MTACMVVNGTLKKLKLNSKQGIDMARKSSDHILSEGENIARIEAMAEHRRTHVDPRKQYTATYLICGKPITETVMAVSQQQALDIVKYNCSLVGWQPTSLQVTEA